MSGPPGDEILSVNNDGTDAGNAARFASLHGADCRYVVEWRTWIVWDGRRWLRDTGDVEITRRARDVAGQYYRQAAWAAEHGNSDASKALAKAGDTASSEQKIRALVKLAQSEPGMAISPEALDREDFALNVANGTLDLTTGETPRTRPRGPDHNPDRC
jgi:putative DNA primase/helicase